jgi:type I restriction enzyme M protein
MPQELQSQTREGYILDYISGIEIKSTPEEIEAVQVFSRQLVEDYGYSKNQIQTRPQWRVKARPSDTRNEYPIDIAIFSGPKKTEENLYIIVECKQRTRKDGIGQLKNYLTLSNAYLGVWFNGNERLFLKKTEKAGRVLFEEIPNIPQCGQRIEDIGRFKRRDLRTPHNLKVIFRAVRNHLAGNTVGATRDEILAQQLINLIFCKIYDEKFTKPDEIVTFRAGVDESAEDVRERILELFEKVKSKYKEVIDFSDKISLDDKSISYVVGELQNYSITSSERDAVADAFETFIDYALKGGQGQFFTPRNIVNLIVEIIDPKPDELIIDPACGSGGFLVESLKYIWSKLEQQAEEFKWSELALTEEKTAAAIHNIRGIEKDEFLSKVTKAYMAIVGDGKGGIFCEDSLERPAEWKGKTRQNIELGKFDVVITNPPFGKEIKIVGDDKLRQYDLAYQWKRDGDLYEKTNKLEKEKQPQILFIERCLQLLKDGGRLAIILPETFFHAPKMGYVLEFIQKHNITWMIDLPHNTFRPHNNAKCLVLVLEKNKKQQKYINMVVAEEMGHDHQGKEIYRWDPITMKVDKSQLWDDIPLIIGEIKSKRKFKYTFAVESEIAKANGVYVPRYYWQSREKEIEEIAAKQKLKLISIQQLINEKIITFFDGHGSPEAENKGRGDVPYIRVSDIVNWEIYKDPTSMIPEGVYQDFLTPKKELKPKDILYVRRGSYRIGGVAMVSPFDTKVLLTREILVLRVARPENQYDIDAYYLLYLLSHRLVALQTRNKVLIETTLPNIADRWKELKLPIHASSADRQDVSVRMKSVIESKWEALKKIEALKNDLGNLVT